jgi:hypothetical protein
MSQNGSWVGFTIDWLIKVSFWLMSNCHVSLGDRVWRQIFRIPMGFACSPLWCNIYFLFYERQFNVKLAKLGGTNIMAIFKYATRYMDDICWINVGDPNLFLDPCNLRTKDNCFWVYPLDITQIKPWVIKYDANLPCRMIEVNFMNLHILIN